MLVGIMSMQRIVNYGSFLQAYALKKIIESMGHSVVFVDYKVGKPICKSRNEKNVVLKKKIFATALHFFVWVRMFDFFLPKSFKYSVKQNRQYQKVCKKYLNIKGNKYNTKVDVLIIGSDEVFNCFQLNPNVGFSPELFGEGSCCKVLATYAASFGNTVKDKIYQYNKEDEISKYLSKFNVISVRDNNSYEIVKALTNNAPSINLDPVLIYLFDNEKVNQVELNNYVIVYAYRNRLSEIEKAFIKEYAFLNKKTIVCIGGYQDFGDYSFIGSPFDVLDYFSKADYIFTDTFHGTIMAIINHKQFVSFVRDSNGGNYGNSEKIVDLLNRLNLKERIFDCGKPNRTVIDKIINYDETEIILSNERKKTLEYLAGCFKFYE